MVEVNRNTYQEQGEKIEEREREKVCVLKAKLYSVVGKQACNKSYQMKDKSKLEAQKYMYDNR